MTARFQTGARMTELIVFCDVANNNVFSYHQNKQLGESVVLAALRVACYLGNMQTGLDCSADVRDSKVIGRM